MAPTPAQIIARKRVEVARARERTPIELLQERVESLPRPRNFFAAVTATTARRQTRVIAEIKQRSPSAGVIREDFDPVAIARQYHQAGAAAISCVTDEADFGGHLGYVGLIRDAVPLPVLRKDFIVEQYQVWVIDGGTPVSGGLFSPDGGTLAVPVDGRVRDGSVVAVTVEDDGGASAPTAKPVIASAPVTLS